MCPNGVSMRAAMWRVVVATRRCPCRSSPKVSSVILSGLDRGSSVDGCMATESGGSPVGEASRGGLVAPTGGMYGIRLPGWW